MNLQAAGGRKFLLCVGVGVATTVLTWAGKIDGAIYATVILGTIGAYVAGNVVQEVKAPKENRDA